MYTRQAVVGGTASSGVIICFLRIITKAALPATCSGLRASTALYFALSGLLSLACFVVYHSVLPRLGVVRFYKQKRIDGERKARKVASAGGVVVACLSAHVGLSRCQEYWRPIISLLHMHAHEHVCLCAYNLSHAASLELSPRPSLLEAEGALHNMRDDDQVWVGGL